MIKKFIGFGTILYVILFNNSYAMTTCPSIAEIKNNNFSEWILYVDNLPATDEDIKYFQENIRNWEQAVWVANTIHDDNAIGGMLSCEYHINNSSYKLNELTQRNVGTHNIPDPDNNLWFRHFPIPVYTCTAHIEFCRVT